MLQIIARGAGLLLLVAALLMGTFGLIDRGPARVARRARRSWVLLAGVGIGTLVVIAVVSLAASADVTTALLAGGVAALTSALLVAVFSNPGGRAGARQDDALRAALLSGRPHLDPVASSRSDATAACGPGDRCGEDLVLATVDELTSRRVVHPLQRIVWLCPDEIAAQLDESRAHVEAVLRRLVDEGRLRRSTFYTATGIKAGFTTAGLSAASTERADSRRP